MPIMHTLTKENATEFAARLQKKFEGKTYNFSTQNLNWDEKPRVLQLENCRIVGGGHGISWSDSYGVHCLSLGARIAFHKTVIIEQPNGSGELLQWKVTPCA